MKPCIKCGELKEDSFFKKGRNQCKECEKQYYKQYNQDHKEEQKQYRQDHKEEQKQYYQDHKEEQKQYRQDHKEKIKQRDKQYYQDHKEEQKQYGKQYRQSKAGKEAMRKQHSKRRNIKDILLMNNPFPEDIIVEDHHILTNIHAIDAEGSWNKWFVIPMPKTIHRFKGGNADNLEHWRHNELWIKKIYDIDINELLGNTSTK